MIEHQPPDDSAPTDPAVDPMDPSGTPTDPPAMTGSGDDPTGDSRTRPQAAPGDGPHPNRIRSSRNVAVVERAALADTLAAVGPDSPTLCEGWTTYDLVAHLVVREDRPDVVPGVAAPAGSRLGAYAEARRREVMARPYDELVAHFRAGPSRLSLFRMPGMDRLANTPEHAIHHEDVLRAQPGWQPRDLPGWEQRQLLGPLKLFARGRFRSSPVGVELVPESGRPVLARAGVPRVSVQGPAMELLLFASGRQAHARVEILGLDDALDQFSGWLEQS